jgi:hypothetical protein
MQPPPLQRFAGGKNDVAHGGDSLILVGANAQRGHGGLEGWSTWTSQLRVGADGTGLQLNGTHCQVRSPLSPVEQLAQLRLFRCCLLPVAHTHAPTHICPRVSTPASRLPSAAAAYASRNVALRPNDIPALGAPDIKQPPFTLVCAYRARPLLMIAQR